MRVFSYLKIVTRTVLFKNFVINLLHPYFKLLDRYSTVSILTILYIVYCKQDFLTYNTTLFITCDNKWNYSLIYLSSFITVTKDYEFICIKCYRRYRYWKNLRRHEMFECGKEPSFQCPYCPYRAKQKSSLHSHVWRRHKKIP